MMGGLCQQAWEGEEDGDERGGCSERGGSGMNRTVGYVTAVFGFLMNLSLPAHWLLSCYCWQEKCSINTHTQSIKTSFAVQKFFKLSRIKEHTTHSFQE